MRRIGVVARGVGGPATWSCGLIARVHRELAVPSARKSSGVSRAPAPSRKAILRPAECTWRDLARIGLGTALARESEAARRSLEHDEPLEEEDAMPWHTVETEVPRATRSVAYARHTETGDPVVCIH